MNKQVAARMESVGDHGEDPPRQCDAQDGGAVAADLVRMAELLGIRDESIHRFNGLSIMARTASAGHLSNSGPAWPLQAVTE
jgi:hypothetical protein